VTPTSRRGRRPTGGADLVGGLLGRWQVLLYLAAVVVGLALGLLRPGAGAALEPVLWPLLGALLLATFLQVPLRRLPEAARDRRFLAAVVLGNFVAVPVVVWGLLALLPDDPALRLGVALVLLVPCTDWFIVFTHLGGGDARRAIVVSPLNLLLQLLLLPLYLWLLAGDATGLFELDRVAAVFVLLVAGPLATAFLVQRHAATRPALRASLQRLEHAPVLLLCLVLLLTAMSQVGEVVAVAGLLSPALAAFAGYLLIALGLGVALSRVAGLTPAAGRALTFSLGTRNSFVVLPFALALPPGYRLAVAVIVLQSLVELFGMLAYLRVVPRLLPASPSGASPSGASPLADVDR
jgi:arsenite transporter